MGLRGNGLSIYPFITIARKSKGKKAMTEEKPYLDMIDL